MGRRWPARGVADAKARRLALGLGGLAALVLGVVLLGYGMAPLKQIADTVGPTFSGGKPPDDLGERLDAGMAELKSRVVYDGIGFILLLGGFVVAKAALGKPKKSVEQLVNEEVARRLAVPAVPSGAPPPLPPPPPSSAPPPIPADTARPSGPPAVPGPLFPPVPPSSSPASTSTDVPGRPVTGAVLTQGRRTHCGACGSVLVAGGRLCPRGHPQV